MLFGTNVPRLPQIPRDYHFYCYLIKNVYCNNEKI